MLTDLRLTHFRCFERLRFAPAPGTNFVIGANAQGKTSILEAACVVTRLQSPRTTSLAEIVRHGETGAAVDAHIRGAHLHLRYEPPKRTLTLDSVPQSGSAEYLSRGGGIAWFGNDDLEILRGPAARRRRYLDFLCAQVDAAYLRRLRAYDRALRSRNALLRDNRPRREIEAFDPILVENGAVLAATRADTVADLAPLIAQSVHDISGSAEAVTAAYLPSSISELPSSRGDESRLRQTVVGPHRDDLALTLAGRDAARFASEGQQRTIALALKLAQTRLLIARTGRTPLLLIDDVFGELDPDRRQRLLAHLPTDAQRLITTTHLGWLDPALPHTTFRLQNHELRSTAGP